MKILPLSDIHLELTSADWDLPTLPPFDVMVMAGDLAPGGVQGVEWLAEKAGDKDSVYIFGNHEFYGYEIDETVTRAREAAKGTRVHVLADESIDILGTTFIGSTLWTDFALLGRPDYAMAVASEFMNDYRRTTCEGRLLRPSDTLARHVASRKFIADELAKPSAGRRRVVVTHHGIHSDAVRPRMRGDLLSASYTSAMEDLVAASGADLFIYGHTHTQDDRLIGSSRVINNGKGYGPSGRRPRPDNPLFDPTMVIEI